jgi:hypothetical protein
VGTGLPVKRLTIGGIAAAIKRVDRGEWFRLASTGKPPVEGAFESTDRRGDRTCPISDRTAWMQTLRTGNRLRTWLSRHRFVQLRAILTAAVDSCRQLSMVGCRRLSTTVDRRRQLSTTVHSSRRVSTVCDDCRRPSNRSQSLF